MGLLGWSWASEESPLKQVSMEILASGHSCFIQCQKASKGGETGRRESIIGRFGNPFLKDTQRLGQPEQGNGSSAPGCYAGRAGKAPARSSGGQASPPVPVQSIPPLVFSMGKGELVQGWVKDRHSSS